MEQAPVLVRPILYGTFVLMLVVRTITGKGNGNGH